MKPLLVDLFCGLGGWTRAFLDEGWDAVGFDIERHDYGTGGYPGQLVLQDVCTLEGQQIAHADCIVASSPCQEFSYRAMPWKRAKALGPPVLGIKLFWQAFRLQREIELATGRRVPLIAENVCGAQKWVGRAAWHYSSFYLWGDVPALMPHSFRVLKQPGQNFHFPEKYGIPSPSFHGAQHEPSVVADLGLKTEGHLNIRDGHTHTRHLTNPHEHGTKQHGSGPEWFDKGIAALSSNSPSRKAASAMIAMIPYPLAQHIARVMKL